jgi:hypothetical protein
MVCKINNAELRCSSTMTAKYEQLISEIRKQTLLPNFLNTNCPNLLAPSIEKKKRKVQVLDQLSNE